MLRRSLQKSTGQAFFGYQSLNTYRYGSRNTYNYSSSSIFHNNCYDSERKCEMEVGAKVGSDSNLGMIASSATKSWKDLKKQNIRYRKVTKGDVIDIREFLFTKDRDYLIRYGDKSVVKADHLEGKVIILYFVSLSLLDPHVTLDEKFNTLVLMHMYNNISPHHGIEIVLVAINGEDEGKSKNRFEDIFSHMPWTAIPFSDVNCRRSLAINFHTNDTTTSFVVDVTGLVLQRDAEFIIKQYGVLGFPFSDERIKQLDAEDAAALQKPSLITLLGSPQRDYVITNKEEKVPIHTLQKKVVALYFYEDSFFDSTEGIIKVYEELTKTGENFEVVLIYLTDTLDTWHWTNENSFWKAFQAMPWLALPFNDPIIQKLKRIFEYPEMHDEEHFDQRPTLVIFGPHGEFIEPLGHCILGEYPVYPFTCENVAKLETKKVQDLKMGMLWDPKTIFTRTDGSQMEFSQLAGKRVVHFFEWDEQEGVRYFLVKLKERYLELKGTDDEFEVIHILEKDTKTMLPIQDLPWFVSLASELLPNGFDFYGSYGENDHGLSTLLAFDRDGKLVRRTIYPAFENTDFPFFAGSMEEETLSQLVNLFGWDYWTFYPGRIYTLHKKLRQPSFNLGGGCRVWNFNLHSTQKIATA